MPFYLRTLLRNADAGQDAGGGGAPAGGAATEVAFAPEQQAKVNSILAAERRKFQQQLAERDTKLTDFEKRFGEFEAEKAKAAEEAELKGKSEAEKALIQFKKADERAKALEADIAKTRADYEGKLKASSEALAAKTKRYSVLPAIAAGAADGASATALREFLASADVQLDEAGEDVASVTYEGKTYDKVADAVKAFYERAPFLAKPPAGGAGSPRTVSGGAPKGPSQFASGADAFAAAMGGNR